MRDDNDIGGAPVEVWNCRLGCTTSQVQAEVIPRLVRIDRVRSGGTEYCIPKAPSPLNTMILGLVAGEPVCMGTIGDERIAGCRGGVGGGNRNPPSFPTTGKIIYLPAHRSPPLQ